MLHKTLCNEAAMSFLQFNSYSSVPTCSLFKVVFLLLFNCYPAIKSNPATLFFSCAATSLVVILLCHCNSRY